MRKNDMRVKWIYVLSMVIILVWYGEKSVSAADLVSGHYISSAGKRIDLALDIQSPAPASVIVEQYLPPDTEIVVSKPEFKKYNRKKGEVKWLLKNVSSGKMTISLQLANAIGKGDVQALIRCKDPATGKFIEKKIHP